MSLSEAEAEARLAALRRQREAIDRAIADLVLYLELGRRLNADGVPAPASGHREAPDPPIAAREAPPPARPAPATASPPPPAVASEPPPRRPPAPRPVAFAQDPAGAREYGRALVAAACEVIAGEGRPLHAREIHDALIARGFAIPGRDPVAALNTRLWKRAGEGGPLRRQGEAVYGLAGD
ncbi:winged helix-turn-helix domain-containing protein [Methylobacterium aerolatum]|uniref:HTH HARE-type domain-containing protein n=1 Tax=Methylobacterium aerolatum TaxID=418708 RepID=A0ABU0I8L5_9HYPH|nr:winged helix-turn-helix domain-containing protein [Methylobacterium aerolatum]MDQ0449984.1 hypothetical protein [Methylobacterium aerolatum]GJD37516.1 hypothetical protein FMGBMHLM_4448 [Methylobacterium aerolatum]